VGSFETVPKVTVQPAGVSEKLLLEISMTALKQAKISWQRMPDQSLSNRFLACRRPRRECQVFGASAKVPSSRPSQARPASSRMRAGKPS